MAVKTIVFFVCLQ